MVKTHIDALSLGSLREKMTQNQVFFVNYFLIKHCFVPNSFHLSRTTKVIPETEVS